MLKTNEKNNKILSGYVYVLCALQKPAILSKKGKQEWTIQRHWQHWAHKRQDEHKQNTKQNTAQKTKKMSITDTTKNRG